MGEKEVTICNEYIFGVVFQGRLCWLQDPVG
jgi:hypothetical protein